MNNEKSFTAVKYIGIWIFHYSFFIIHFSFFIDYSSQLSVRNELTGSPSQ